MNKRSPYELQKNPFTLYDKQWALITTRAGDQTNTMTASWGGLGIMWHKPVVYIVLRPQRYTRELLDKSELFSVGFLPEQYRKQLNRCGTVSGRNEDKIAACGFEIITLDGAPVIAQSQLALTCRKLFRQSYDPSSFIDKTVETANYPQKDYHFLYIAEILGAYEND